MKIFYKNNFKKTVFCSVLAMGVAFAAPASADLKKVSVYDLRHNTAAYDLTEQQREQLDVFLIYYDREPCQNYQDVPVGFVYKNCDLFMEVAPAPEPVVYVEPPVAELAPVVVPEPPQKTLASYKVYFGLDKHDLDADDQIILSRVAREITKYEPSEVTVEGHTDTSGDIDYNYNLSQKRAQEVSGALTDKGVTNRVIDKNAYGETQLDVPTADGVVEQENRRVVVKFLK